MARTAISVQTIPPYGVGLADVVFSAADAANGHEFVNSGRCLLLVKNGDAAPHTAAVSLNGSDRVYAEAGTKDTVVVAGDEAAIGPFSQAAFNQDGDGGSGMVLVDFAVDTSVTVAVVEFSSER